MVDGVSGILFADPSVDALKDAIERFDGVTFDPERIRSCAERFSPERFRRQIRAVALGASLHTLKS